MSEIMILLYIERYARFQHGISKNNEYFASLIKKRWTNVQIVEELSSQTNKLQMVLNFENFSLSTSQARYVFDK